MMKVGSNRKKIKKVNKLINNVTRTAIMWEIC
jgi:hypothetical protein